MLTLLTGLTDFALCPIRFVFKLATILCTDYEYREATRKRNRIP